MKSRMKHFLISFFVVVLCVVFLATPTYALIWNGSSSADGGGGTASNGYAVNIDGTSLIGFRFSLVNSDDSQCGNSVDVFTGASMDTYSELSSAKKFNVKKSKAHWASNYSSLSADDATLSTSTGNSGCYVQSDMGFKDDLPVITGLSDINNNMLANNLNAWQETTPNIEALLDKINYMWVEDVDDMAGYTIIVEPILQVRLAGDRHALTMTELALFGGGFVFDGNWDSNGGSSSNTGSWGFISEYTNKYFPMYMTTNGAECNWDAPSTLKKRATFRDIITKGYGVSVLTGEPTLTVVYHSNDADQRMYDRVSITEDELVNNYRHHFRDSDYYEKGLWDVNNVYELYLTKDGYMPTGNWLVGSSTSTKKISQTFAGTGQELAEALGTTLEDGSKVVHVYAEWKAQPTEAQYVVCHYLQGIDDKFTLEEAETFIGTPGVSLTLADLKKTFDGFTYNFSSVDGVRAETATVRPDGSLVIDLFYTRNQYKVTLLYGTGIEGTSGAGTYYYGEDVAIDAFVSPGYVWSKWSGYRDTTTKHYTFTMPAQNVNMTAHAVVDTDVSYIVNHHLMNLDGRTYALKEKETLTGTAGKTIRFANLVKTYVGFSYKEGKIGDTVAVETTLQSGVPCTIDLYYTRNQYTVILNKTAGILDTTGAGTYYYDEEVIINATVSDGYTWGAWTGYFLSTEQEYVFKMPAENVELIANAVSLDVPGEDAPPFINAVDRWFLLDEAQAGKITLDELMKTAEAVDSLVGDVTDFRCEGTFTILGYNEDNKDALADEFKRFTASGSATVTYYAVDKAGNTAFCTVTVHIVARDRYPASTGCFTRFISADYFGGIADQYVAEKDGGLNSNSVWIKNDEYRMKLIDALYNLQNESSGKWHTVYRSWTFTKEHIAEVKQYVEDHGLGKAKSDDAMNEFIQRFMRR